MGIGELDGTVESAGRRARAETRRRLVVLRRTNLREAEDLSPVSGPEAVSLVHRLTLESWSLSRAEQPAYDRQNIPCSFVPHLRG